MAPSVIDVDVIIVVLPIASASIVRRVDIDAVDLARVEVAKELECMMVVGFDQRVPGCVCRTILNLVHRYESRENTISELPDHHEIFNLEGLLLGSRCMDALSLVLRDRDDLPDFREGSIPGRNE